MFAQLGTTVFDGLKSFVSFNNDQEAIIVEHALIGRKPQLQGAAIGLRNISLSIFLHQEYSKVSQEIDKLRDSLNTFEILPLLWGNGKLEGDFVIANMSVTHQDMDALGNIIAAEISLSLKESANNDKVNQQEQQGKQNAFAVGDKKPPTKSNRTNKDSCSYSVSKRVSVIKSHGGVIDNHSRAYTNDAALNNKMLQSIDSVIRNTSDIQTAANDQSSCVSGKPAISSSSADLLDSINILKNHVDANQARILDPFYNPDIAGLKAKNANVQVKIRALQSATNSTVQSSIVKK